MHLTQQFIALGKKISAEVSALRQSIDAIRYRQEKQDQQCSSEQKPEPPPVVVQVRAELDVPDAEKTANRAHEKHQIRVQWAQVVVTFLAFTAAAIYAGIAAYQLKQMKTAAKAAQDAANAATSAAETSKRSLESAERTFKIQQRPYLVGEAIGFIEPLAVGTTGKANIVLRNIGHGPALNVGTYARFVRIAPPVPRNQGFITLIDKIFNEVAANATNDVNNPKTIKFREDTAPNGSQYFTRALPSPLSGQDLANLRNGSAILLYLGITTYSDPFGETYSTEFCHIYFGQDPNVWHYCPTHNRIH